MNVRASCWQTIVKLLRLPDCLSANSRSKRVTRPETHMRAETRTRTGKELSGFKESGHARVRVAALALFPWSVGELDDLPHVRQVTLKLYLQRRGPCLNGFGKIGSRTRARGPL